MNCCYAALRQAVDDVLNDFSEDMADPELCAYTTNAVAIVIATHMCDG